MTLDRLQLVRRLGRGGNAEVWRATPLDGALGDVVVKRMARHLTGDARLAGMLREEARLLGLLDHESIPQLFELSGTADDPVMVMELVDGPSLLDVIRGFSAGGALPVPLCAYVMARVCRALWALHTVRDRDGRPLQAVHRDVSPSNILLCVDGGVKLVDFGISHVLVGSEAPRTETGLLKGKARFMAPETIEQASGKRREIDGRADLFSAGVVLHELLTGRRLFQGTSEAATLDQVRLAPIVPPSSSRPEVPAELDRLCLRALERDPDRRFADAGQMAEALERSAGGQGGKELEAWLAWRAESGAGTGDTDGVMAAEGTATTDGAATVIDTGATVFQKQIPPRRRRMWLPWAALGVAVGVGVIWAVMPSPPPPRATMTTAPTTTAETPPTTVTTTTTPTITTPTTTTPAIAPPPTTTAPATAPPSVSAAVRESHRRSSSSRRKPSRAAAPGGKDPLRGASILDPFQKK